MKNNMKILIKFIVILLIGLMLASFITPVLADTGLDTKFSEFNDDKDKTPENVKKLVNNTSGTAISVLRIASVTIAVVMLLVIAMRYMVSSASDRADIKKHAVAYVIGAFILFGVTAILGMLVDLSAAFGNGD
jgi:hypothetical protein